MITFLIVLGCFALAIGLTLLIIFTIEYSSAHGAGKRRGLNESNYSRYSNEYKRRSLAYAYDRGFKRGKKIIYKRENAKNWGEEYTKAHDKRKAEADHIAKINGG